jgi:hypothetical protein
LDGGGFEDFWVVHPDRYHVIQMHGRPVETPRWKQACGVDYRNTGRTNSALPVSSALEPFRNWARRSADEVRPVGAFAGFGHLHLAPVGQRLVGQE